MSCSVSVGNPKDACNNAKAKCSILTTSWINGQLRATFDYKLARFSEICSNLVFVIITQERTYFSVPRTSCLHHVCFPLRKSLERSVKKYNDEQITPLRVLNLINLGSIGINFCFTNSDVQHLHYFYGPSSQSQIFLLFEAPQHVLWRQWSVNCSSLNSLFSHTNKNFRSQQIINAYIISSQWALKPTVKAEKQAEPYLRLHLESLHGASV